ncbi:putative chromatin binding protein [Trypanosoma rangeli]|uniref:Putative chromatin binding protein n=1 Tax=Trypanosoma rangeli TaxID=5698 RepID=A0A3R7KBV0_TRYRA|nr:putative chromatin binding protein [Trypanosoma rangeli]RNF03378.1 putative chromatin binding protein [Trypanosoma rangeli]|eukprot:RNF03378.1 putative chromatin binding protein [Trypanosoma rangeli]
MLDAAPSAASSCERTAAVLGKHLAEGETLVKVVHCSNYYGAALFRSGSLVLLAPESPAQHGTVIEGGDGHVRDVAAGATHIVFCKEDGTVHSFGYSNTHGQLGDGTVWRRWPAAPEMREADASATAEREEGLPQLSPPQMIGGFGVGRGGGEAAFMDGRLLSVPIAAVACGAFHTLLLTSLRNCVYACGLGVSGQLGGRRRPVLQPSFRSIRLLFGLPLRQIAAAGNHSFVLLQTGKLFAFGENLCGQLGFGSAKAVRTPRAVNFNGAAPCEETRRPLDTAALKSLRAARGSAESMYVPLRVERLCPERAPGEPFIVAVWCCPTITVLLTEGLEWLSCGLALSRSPCDRKTSARRVDRYGPLGRWLAHKEEATLFRKMRWSERVAAALKSALPTHALEGPSLEEALGAMDVKCSTKAVVLLLRHAAEPHGAHLFLQGEVPEPLLIDQAGGTPLIPAYRAEKLLYDHDVDDDAFEFTLAEAQGIFATEAFMGVV